jgi:hypothetical protein
LALVGAGAAAATDPLFWLQADIATNAPARYSAINFVVTVISWAMSLA